MAIERPRDAVDESLWRPLRKLWQAMDDDISRLYRERGIGIQTSHSMVIIRLASAGPMTIRALADSLDITHSAASQKVSALRKAGYVVDTAGDDLRTKVIVLTDRGAELAPFLAAEWSATESAATDLERELPYPLSRVVDDMREALQRRSFHDRIVARIDTNPPEPRRPAPDVR